MHPEKCELRHFRNGRLSAIGPIDFNIADNGRLSAHYMPDIWKTVSDYI